jgi:sec-independent protein translocase protein TatA
MFDFSPVQILLVLVIALIVFGPKRLPELGRTLGRGLREFRSHVSGLGEEHDVRDEPVRPPSAPPPAAAGPAAATAAVVDDEADEVLEGVVLDGAEPPRGPAPGA